MRAILEKLSQQKANSISDHLSTPSEASTANSQKSSSDEEAVAVRTKLYVSNFPENCTRRHLTEFFSKFGQVLECAIMWDTYAFIHYGTMTEAKHALKQASNTHFMGRKLSIQLSTSRNRQSFNWYQEQAAKMQKELFEKSQSDLNTSNHDSSSISNLTSPSNCLVETKLYVTNLPENCNQIELKSLFEKHGNVLECVIMWNQYAFVHFADLAEAKIALKHLHGYLFHGKNLIVQLSTSSNRPLPKCLVFNKLNKNSDSFTKGTNLSELNFNNKSNNRFESSRENKENIYKENSTKKINETFESSILCYRAADTESFNEKSSSSNKLPKTASTEANKNWIQILKEGSLPPLQTNTNNAKSSQSKSKSLSINLNELFLNASKMNESTAGSNSDNKIVNETIGEIICLSEIPTPDKPDLSSKMPTSNKKIISDRSGNNIDNFGYLSLATVQNELKKLNNSTGPNSLSSVKETEVALDDDDDDSQADADSDIDFNPFEKINFKSNMKKSTLQPIKEMPKQINSKIRLDQVPTPPIPLKPDQSSLTGTELDLKNLILSINKKENKQPQQQQQPVPIVEPLVDDTSKIDAENERILIEKLNNLKYESKLIDTLVYSDINEYSSGYASSTSQNSNEKGVKEDSSLKSIWKADANSENKINFYLSPSSLSSSSSSLYALSTESNMPAVRPESAQSDSPITIDYLNKKCVYEENLIQNSSSDVNYKSGDLFNLNQLIQNDRDDYRKMNQLNDMNIGTANSGTDLASPKLNDLNAAKVNNSDDQTNNKSNKKQLSRCKVVNYILFPELKEQDYINRKEYEKAVFNLVKKNYSVYNLNY